MAYSLYALPASQPHKGRFFSFPVIYTERQQVSAYRKPATFVVGVCREVLHFDFLISAAPTSQSIALRLRVDAPLPPTTAWPRPRGAGKRANHTLRYYPAIRATYAGQVTGKALAALYGGSLSPWARLCKSLPAPLGTGKGSAASAAGQQVTCPCARRGSSRGLRSSLP